MGGNTLQSIRRKISKTLMFYKRESLLLIFALLSSIFIGTFTFQHFKVGVYIQDEGSGEFVTAIKTKPQAILQKAGYVMDEKDEMKGEFIKDANDATYAIDIARGKPFRVVENGVEKEYISAKSTVKDALLNVGIQLGELDKVESYALDETLQENMLLALVRVKEEEEVLEEPLQYDTIRRESPQLAKGEERVLREGSEGSTQKVFRVLFENGKMVARNLVTESIIVPPVSRIVEVGGPNNYRTSRGGVIRASRVLSVQATAYTAHVESTGKTPDHPAYGITASGTRVGPGTIAVDPRLIPLGTRLYVELEEGIPDYGFSVAADTGSAIKGNIIDLYFEERETAIKFGRRRAKVYVLEN